MGDANLDDLDRRLRAVEAALCATGTPADPAAPTGGTRAADVWAGTEEDTFWALAGLKDRVGEGVLFTGSANLGEGPLEYQYARPVTHLLDLDWAALADRIGALGHPVRLAILRRLLDGDASVADLVADLDLGSAGVAYHHLNLLTQAGWARSLRRGRYQACPQRVIALLTILTAVEA